MSADVKRPTDERRATFTAMERATADDWDAVKRNVWRSQKTVPLNVIAMLQQCENLHFGFGVSQLHHMLQTATMATRANARDEVVLAALCHDVGKVISVLNHESIAAEMLRPYVSSDVYQVLLKHQEFQSRYYGQQITGQVFDVEERYRGEPWFDLAKQFVYEWDQAAFDPSYPIKPLSEFEPLVHALLGKMPEHLRKRPST